jgi:hypothetical protein
MLLPVRVPPWLLLGRPYEQTDDPEMGDVGDRMTVAPSANAHRSCRKPNRRDGPADPATSPFEV